VSISSGLFRGLEMSRTLCDVRRAAAYGFPLVEGFQLGMALEAVTTTGLAQHPG
jgi:hypothetical protein